MPADGEARLVGQAGLFEIQQDVVFTRQFLDGVCHHQGIVLFPAGVGICIQYFTRFHAGCDLLDPVDVRQRVCAHFDLIVAVALGPVFCDSGSHCIRVGAGHDLIQLDLVLLFAAQQRIEW